MRTLLIAVVMCVTSGSLAWGQAADATAGKALWNGTSTMCRNCHGVSGEGGFGPDLAGRGLTVAHFRRAVRQPFGIMPAFTEEQLSDQQMAALAAYFDTLPRSVEPAAFRFAPAAAAPLGQQLAIANGCTQCHGAELMIMRQSLGAVAADFPTFTSLVYDHTNQIKPLHAAIGDTAPIRMGNYSRYRLPESTLQEIWKYLTVDLGFRIRLQARVTAVEAAPRGTMYTLTVLNTGVPGKAETAEEVTLAVTLPAGATVASTTGEGYQGITHDDQRNADIARWRVRRIAPKDTQAFTITLSGSGAAAGIQAGTVTWAKPLLKNGNADSITVALPPRPPASQ